MSEIYTKLSDNVKKWTLRDCQTFATPVPESIAEVDLISSFIECPSSRGFMAEPVGTRQGCSLMLHKRADERALDRTRLASARR